MIDCSVMIWGTVDWKHSPGFSLPEVIIYSLKKKKKTGEVNFIIVYIFSIPISICCFPTLLSIPLLRVIFFLQITILNICLKMWIYLSFKTKTVLWAETRDICSLDKEFSHLWVDILSFQLCVSYFCIISKKRFI